MENNNAIAVQEPDGEAKIEDVKPTVEDEELPSKGRRYNRYNNRRPQTRRDVHPEDETGKWSIRRKIWNHLEDNNLVNAPRPCHFRIPNFEGAAAANDHLTSLEEFKKARTIKVNPDKTQEQARFLVLEDEKELVLLNQSERTLVVPTPQVRAGLLNRIIPPEDANKEQLRHCCTSQGVSENSKEIGLEDKIRLDMIVIGSVAVSREGFRIGKGKGYADLEYAMMRTMGAADKNTVVVTSVHDSQVVDIPKELVEEHDVTVDYILTPTEVIKTNCTHPKPSGVIWDHLEIAKFYQIPILRQLREMERDAGKNVMLKDQKEEDEDPVDSIKPPRPRKFNRFNNRFRGRGRGGYRFRRGGGGGGRRRQTDGDDSNKENAETGDESGADGDNENRGRRPRNYRNRRFRRGGRMRASESEHSDGGGEGNQRDDEDDRPQKRYSNRRRYNYRRRRFGGNRRDNRASGDHSGSDGEQKTSGDEGEEGNQGRRIQRPRLRINPDAVVFVGSLSRNLRVSELKTELRSHNVNPMRLLWRGGRGFAFLYFMETSSAKEAVNVLSGRELDGREIKVEMANMDRQSRRRPRNVDGDERGEDDLDSRDR